MKPSFDTKSLVQKKRDESPIVGNKIVKQGSRTAVNAQRTENSHSGSVFDIDDLIERKR